MVKKLTFNLCFFSTIVVASSNKLVSKTFSNSIIFVIVFVKKVINLTPFFTDKLNR